MSKNWTKTIESYFGDKEDQGIQTEDNKVKAPTSKDSKKNMNWSQAMEELKKNFENQEREVEQKLGREMKVMQENHEKWVNCLLKGAQRNGEENDTLKNRLIRPRWRSRKTHIC